MNFFTTTITFSGGYTRGPFLAVTRRYRAPFPWIIQPCWHNGRGGTKYDPALPGHEYKTRREAEAAKKLLRGATP